MYWGSPLNGAVFLKKNMDKLEQFVLVLFKAGYYVRRKKVVVGAEDKIRVVELLELENRAFDIGITDTINEMDLLGFDVGLVENIQVGNSKAFKYSFFEREIKI